MPDETISSPTPGSAPGRTMAKGWQPPSTVELQALLPQYEITLLLGRGGMGSVYKGTQKNLDRPVAIKILPPDMEDSDGANFAERFKNEARAMAKLNHPGIVGVYDSGETASGLLYIVIEFIEGTDVSRMVAQQGRLHTDHAMAITAHVCDALQYAHERGIIHRDIKPANIMVGYDGVVKVADFGLAKMNKAGESGLTRSGMAMGTLHYMAPEALMLGISVDHRADVYAVGVMLYQMLTGKLPQGMFDPPSQQVPGLDPRFDKIIAKAIRDDRDSRYQSASAMRADLDGILTQPVIKVEANAYRAPAALPTQARPQRPAGQPYRPPSSPVKPRKPRQFDLRYFAANVLLLGGLACGFWWFKLRPVGDLLQTTDLPANSNKADEATAKIIALASNPVSKPAETMPAITAMPVKPEGRSDIKWLGSWHHTTISPAGAWFAEKYDDRTWAEGEGPFGNRTIVDAKRIRTEWETSDLWLRRSFELPPGTPPEHLILRCWFDGAGEIFINGVQAARFTGWNGEHQITILSERSLAALHSGTNLLAARCHSSSKPQVLDATLELEPAAKRPLKPAAVTQRQLSEGLFVGELQQLQPTIISGDFLVNAYPMGAAELQDQNIRVLLAGKPCKFIFSHAPGRIVYDLPPLARRFTAHGISASANPTVGLMRREWSYTVSVDGTRLFTSKPLNEYPNGEVAIDVAIPAGSKQLILITDPLGSNNSDHALWANPLLHDAATTPPPATPNTPQLWIDSKGRSLQALFKAVEGNNVLLEIAEKDQPVPMNTLSGASQQQARDLQQQTKPPSLAPNVGTTSLSTPASASLPTSLHDHVARFTFDDAVRETGADISLGLQHDGVLDLGEGWTTRGEVLLHCPQLDYAGFTLVARLRPTDSDRRVLLCGGRLYRWLAINQLSSTQLEVTLNNREFNSIIDGVSLPASRTLLLVVACDLKKRQITVTIDKQKEAVVELPPYFKFNVLGTNKEQDDKVWTFYNYGLAIKPFQGLVEELLLYNRMLKDSEVRQLQQGGP